MKSISKGYHVPATIPSVQDTLSGGLSGTGAIQYFPAAKTPFRATTFTRTIGEDEKVAKKARGRLCPRGLCICLRQDFERECTDEESTNGMGRVSVLAPICIAKLIPAWFVRLTVRRFASLDLATLPRSIRLCRMTDLRQDQLCPAQS